MKHIPIELRHANAFVQEHHRHHKPVIGHKFSIGAVHEDRLIGVAIVGRPVSRHRDDGWTLEVTRLCTDGTRNACSFLYSKAARCAFAMGYKRIGTYILKSEDGSSLKASNWRMIGERGGGRWNCNVRKRLDLHPREKKTLYEIYAKDSAEYNKLNLPSIDHCPVLDRNRDLFESLT